MSRKLARKTVSVLDDMAARREGTAPAMPEGAGTLPGIRQSAAPVAQIGIDMIADNPHQPRTRFEAEPLEALAASIARHGLLEPIGVKRLDDGRYQLAYGERRLRACRSLGHDTIPCVILKPEVPEDEITVLENILREDLDPFEEADAFATLLDRRGYTQAELAKLVGRNASDMSKSLSLRRLPDPIREEYPRYKPARYKLHEIAALKEEEAQLQAWSALKAAAEAPEKPNAPARAARPAPAEEVPSALPRRVAAKIHQAQEVLLALRDAPKPLWDSDVERLRAIRDAIDGILEKAEEEAGSARP